MITNTNLFGLSNNNLATKDPIPYKRDAHPDCGQNSSYTIISLNCIIVSNRIL